MGEVIDRLREIARCHGTPTYAYDVRRLRAQVERLRSVLPREVELLYSLKANASLGICDVFADAGIGADVASAGELATAVAAGFPGQQIFVAGPFKMPETLALLRDLPDAILSVDSPSELEMLADEQVCNRAVLRLRPDFESSAAVSAGHESRFGFTLADLERCKSSIGSCGVAVVGFHIFAGSQILDSAKVVAHFHGAFELSQRAADLLGFTPTVLNLGGGFGIPYAPHEQELDLEPIAAALREILERAPMRLLLELGRYLVAQSGWYLTSVVGHQEYRGRAAVIVDGGTHQRADMCGLCLRSRAAPPVVLGATRGLRSPVDVLGCLSLPADVLAESSLLPSLAAGDVLAFGNAGAYGLWSSPALFHGSPLPAEVVFDGESIQIIRERLPARSILQDQRHIEARGMAKIQYRENATGTVEEALR